MHQAAFMAAEVQAGRAEQFPPAAAAVSLPSRSAALAGSPDLPFAVRFSLTFASTSHHAILVVLVRSFIIAVCLMRAPQQYVELRALLLCYAAAVLCELAWRRACHGTPDGGRYARWRHLALPAFMLGDLLLARHQIVRAGFEATLRLHMEGVNHGLTVILASRALSSLIVWFLCHRLIYALPAQLIIVAHHLRANLESCDSMLSAAPSAVAWVHNAAAAIELSQLGGIGTVARSRPLTSAEECRAILAWQQLCFGLVVPALVAAVVETRLWRRHQEERRQSGLPPEGGWQSSFYRALQELLIGHDWPHILVLSWLLSGVLHLAAVALSVDA